MKTNLTIASATLLASCLALPAFADTHQKTVTTRGDLPAKGHSAWHDTVPDSRREALGPILRADELIGSAVMDLREEKLGKVEDLAIDTVSGRVTHVVVTSGGVLGIGSRTTAVPPGSFMVSRGPNPLRLDTTPGRLRNAPDFDFAKWEDHSRSGKVAEYYRHHGTEPYFSDGVNSTEKEAVTTDGHRQPLGHLVRASEVIGMTVRNPGGEMLGRVENLLFDLRSGRVNQVVLSAGGFLGVGDELSVVPPASLKFSESDGHLVLDTTKEALLAAPRLARATWTDAREAPFVTKVYRAFGVEPYFDPAAPVVWYSADNTGRNRDASAKTAEDQSSDKADVEITRDIRRQIIAAEGLSMNAMNVKIITENGQVTLRGPVNSEREKQVIADLAAKVVGREKIDNRLEAPRSVVRTERP